MTNPPGPPPGDSPWARPGEQVPPPARRPQAPQPPSQSPTRQMNIGGSPTEPPTRQIPVDAPSTDPQTRQLPHAEPPSAGQAGQAGPPPPPLPPDGLAAPVKRRRNPLRDPVSIALILVTVLAVAVAAVIGAELYVRHVAETKVAEAVKCEVGDTAAVSFAATPPVLWQHITGHYTNISVQTTGNQIREAKDMTVDIDIRDVDLTPSGDSKGTIGALDADITWTAKGIQQTIQDMIPMLGSLVVSSAATNPNDDTIELKGALSHITAKPKIVDNGLALEVVNFSGLGFTLPRESVQSLLDEFTAKLTKDYPLGIHADSVQVTDTGVVVHFSTRNAAIPADQKHPCFANI